MTGLGIRTSKQYVWSTVREANNQMDEFCMQVSSQINIAKVIKVSRLSWNCQNSKETHKSHTQERTFNQNKASKNHNYQHSKNQRLERMWFIDQGVRRTRNNRLGPQRQRNVTCIWKTHEQINKGRRCSKETCAWWQNLVKYRMKDLICNKYNMQIELVLPGFHSHNKAKVSISNFKCYSLSIIAGVANNFLMYLWIDCSRR